jgi:hypothetical protein
MQLTLNGKTYDADPSKLTNRELMRVEDLYGWTPTDLTEKMQAGSMRALTAFAWLLACRDDPSVEFDDIVFTMTELADGIVLSDDEARDALARADDPAVFLASLPEDQQARLAVPTVAPSGA